MSSADRRSKCPQEAGPCRLPSPVPTPPPSSPSSTINTPHPPTHPPPCFPSHPAGLRLLPISHLLPTERAPPPGPQGSPLLARWLLLLAGDCPCVTRHGEETQSLHGPQSGWRPSKRAGARVRMLTCTGVCRLAYTRTRLHAHTALPPPTQGAWASGRGCSRITVFGPHARAVPPGRPGAVGVLKGCWPGWGPVRGVDTPPRADGQLEGGVEDVWAGGLLRAFCPHILHPPGPDREPGRRPRAGGRAQGRRGVRCACAWAGRAALGSPSVPAGPAGVRGVRSPRDRAPRPGGH